MDKLLYFFTSNGEKWAVPMAIVQMIANVEPERFAPFKEMPLALASFAVHVLEWHELEAYAVKLQDAPTLNMSQEWTRASPSIETTEDLSDAEKVAFAVVLARAKATVHNKPLE